jgi:uncharacterized phage protein (TIGR01671 family)
MRQIKFRVWIGTKMEYNILAGTLGVFYVPGPDPKDAACVSPMNTKYDEPTRIMQFTGLLDKTGKEIYEGDIAEEEIFMIMGDPIGKIRIVFDWENAGFIKRVLDSKGGIGFIPNGAKSDLAKVSTKDAANHCEIVGNIYESPELLPKTEGGRR